MSVWGWLRHRAWPFVSAVLTDYGRDQGGVLAGYIAYSAMLSGFPFLIFSTALAALAIGRNSSDEAFALLFDAVPPHVAQTLEPVLRQVISQNNQSILTLSGVGALWAASNGVEAVRIALDKAYGVTHPRNFVLNRLISIGFVLLATLTFLILAVLIIFAPLMLQLVEFYTGAMVPSGVDAARYVIALILLVLIFALMHLILPERPMSGMVLWPGILASVTIWVLAATGLSVYVAYSPTYSLTYGTLAGVVVTLLFFYLTGVAIILGAEINAVANRRPSEGKAEGRGDLAM